MKSHSAILEKTHAFKKTTSPAVKLVQSHSFSAVIRPAARPCVSLSAEREKRGSASYLEEACLEHEWRCHGSAVTWTAGTWKFTSKSREEFKESRNHNKPGWQHTTATPTFGEIHRRCCVSYVLTQGVLWNTQCVMMGTYFSLLYSEPCLGTHSLISLIFAAIDPTGNNTWESHDNRFESCCEWMFAWAKWCEQYT